nr:MAG TPA: meiotically up-regulated protein 113 [Caudoviricetes sp.]
MPAKITIEEFISRAKDVHGNKYDYNLVKFNKIHDKISITCRYHGEFMQRAYSHLAGFGCSMCSGKKKMNSTGFISKAISIHGDKYGYKNVKYKNNHTPVTITCMKHGDFKQTPSAHTSGQGCPSCAARGFDRNRVSFVYFLMGDGSIKVGVTKDIKNRVRHLKVVTPFDFDLIHKIKTDGVKARKIEKYYHKKYESSGFKGFNGATEWLKYSPELMNEIMKEAP